MNAPAVPILTRLREYERRRPFDVFALLEALLFGVIVLLLLGGLVAGVLSYKAISDTRANDERARIGSSAIANSVRFSDSTDAVAVGQGPEGPALVLTEQGNAGAYQTRIYQYRGKLLEEYALADSPYNPDRATALMDNEHFEFVYDEGLLTVTTDAGESMIALHSEGGAS